MWDIVSDLDNEPKFWKGTKQIRNISSEGNKITREVTIAFRDSKCMQEVTLFPKEKIEAVFTDGIIKGTKTINLKPSEKGVNSRSSLGYETLRDDGDVYWNDKKTCKKWNRTSS